MVLNNETKDPIPDQDFFLSLVKKCLTAVKTKGNQVELGIHFISPEKIQELNKKHRNKDKATDVLSFPLGKESINGIISLGDIFICFDVAKVQAKEDNVSMEQKVAQLAVHGLLHLLGYDHEKSERAAKEMFNLESEILRVSN